MNTCIMAILPRTAYEVKTTLNLRLSVVNVRQGKQKIVGKLTEKSQNDD